MGPGGPDKELNTLKDGYCCRKQFGRNPSVTSRVDFILRPKLALGDGALKFCNALQNVYGFVSDTRF